MPAPDFMPDHYVSVAASELDQLRRDSARLASSDLERIRLRDSLRVACERLTVMGDEADRVWTAEIHERWFK